MTTSRTIDIPADHRVTLELPPDLPIGKAKIEFTIKPDTPKEFNLTKDKKYLEWIFGKSIDQISEEEIKCLEYTMGYNNDPKYKREVPPLESLRGINKGLDTMDAYFERKRADKAKEDELFWRGRQPPQ
jgi:hypothetical protein